MGLELRSPGKDVSATQLRRLGKIINLLEQNGVREPAIQMLADGGINVQLTGSQEEEVLNVYIDRNGLSSDYNCLQGANLHCEHRNFSDDDSVVAYIRSKRL